MSVQVIQGLRSVRLTGVVLSVGNFDGVHRGHQAILSVGRGRARAVQTQMVAMTFEPHPATVLAPDRVPPILTPLDEKVRWLEAAGADVVVVVDSRPEFFSCPAEAFIEQVIVERFRPAAVVEGASFRFGQHRQGDVELLRAAGGRFGFGVEIISPVRVDLGGHPDTAISSSLVRHLLDSGTVDRAAVCLGRPYALVGQVEHGVARGRTLGFATANLAVHAGQLVPAEGVYAGRTSIDGTDYAAAISIGCTPTFGGERRLVEAHVLDYAGDLYGRAMRLEFLAWLRGQQTFGSPAALKAQVQTDIAQARRNYEASTQTHDDRAGG
ncbi:MAG: bifunctional riboflavin kinase/FAD synthetase [Planctomycetes bacterium]|nr:bifunctional riboflavin kinase/FAD synthetase [Planctomycetota bacterium]